MTATRPGRTVVVRYVIHTPDSVPADMAPEEGSAISVLLGTIVFLTVSVSLFLLVSLSMTFTATANGKNYF